MGKKRGSDAPTESKKARFVRVVKPRVNKAIKSIRVIGYCSASAYEYDSKQVDSILNTLSAELVALKKRFEGKKKQEDAGFDFSED